jgi:hypothetical protein
MRNIIYGLAVIASAVALATPAAAAISASSRTVETHQIESRGAQEAKFKWPKIHKCKPINKGIECEIKTSELSPREQAERAAAEAMVRANAERERMQQRLREDQQRRQQEIENNRRLEDAKRRGATG